MQEIRYKFREGFKGGSDKKAQTVALHIEEMKARNSGKITEEEVLEDARNPDSPLHPFFTWDPSLAARKHNLGEARLLIRSYEVWIIEDNKKPIVICPANVIVRRPDCEPAYESTALVMNERDMKAKVLQDAANLLRGVERRVLSLRGISPAIAEAFAQLIELMELEQEDKRAEREEIEARMKEAAAKKKAEQPRNHGGKRKAAAKAGA
jgi:hypothetical protein